MEIKKDVYLHEDPEDSDPVEENNKKEKDKVLGLTYLLIGLYEITLLLLMFVTVYMMSFAGLYMLITSVAFIAVGAFHLGRGW